MIVYPSIGYRKRVQKISEVEREHYGIEQNVREREKQESSKKNITGLGLVTP
jgi:hypothetical protein